MDKNGESNKLLNPKDVVATSEQPDFLLIFEDLLRKFEAGGKQKVQLEGETLFAAGENPISQELFVSPGRNEIPKIGATLTQGENKMTYSARFFIGRPPAYGEIWVGEFQFEASKPGKGLSLPGELIGSKGAELSQIYDASIIQAAANIYGRKILHSIEVPIDNKERREYLIENGYALRQSYLQILDKIYEPEVRESNP